MRRIHCKLGKLENSFKLILPQGVEVMGRKRDDGNPIIIIIIFRLGQIKRKFVYVSVFVL